MPAPRILALARGLIKGVKVKPRDALLLACAETGRCDYFVSCDDALIRTVRVRRGSPKLRLVAVNPVDFVRREGESGGQSSK